MFSFALITRPGNEKVGMKIINSRFPFRLSKQRLPFFRGKRFALSNYFRRYPYLAYKRSNLPVIPGTRIVDVSLQEPPTRKIPVLPIPAPQEKARLSPALTGDTLLL